MGHAIDLQAQIAIIYLPPRLRGSNLSHKPKGERLACLGSFVPDIGRRFETVHFQTVAEHLDLQRATYDSLSIQKDCAPIALRYHGDNAAPWKESHEISIALASIGFTLPATMRSISAPTSFQSFSFNNIYSSPRAGVRLIAYTFPSGCFWLWPTHQQQPTSRRHGRHMPKRSHRPQGTPPRAY